VVRVQAQLTEEQHQQLRRLSNERGTSVAALLREGADRMLAESQRPADAAWQRAWRAVGSVHGGAGNVAEEHDRYLAEIYGQW
jgi:hypothetical protein